MNNELEIYVLAISILSSLCCIYLFVANELLTRRIEQFEEGITVADKSHLFAVTSYLEDVAAAIHYPECWDVAAYPKLSDAVNEFCCNPECCVEGAKNG